MLNKWIEDNYQELKKIVRKVSRTTDDDDLLQICIEQFMLNKKVNEIPDNQKLYFFARIVQNNFKSNSSPYYYTYYKYKFSEFNNNSLQIQDSTYQENEFDLNWVHNELKKIDYYYRRLFELYIEENCSITKLSKRTTIPLNSVSRDINKVRKILNKNRNKFI